MTNKPPPNPKVYPLTWTETTNYNRYQHREMGITLRDWFAGMALSGASAKCSPSQIDIDARWMYALADAMLAERIKPSASKSQKEGDGQ